MIAMSCAHICCGHFSRSRDTSFTFSSECETSLKCSFHFLSPKPWSARLSCLAETAGVIGSMYLDMAVQALLAEHALVCTFRRDTGTAVNATGMEVRQVTLLANVRLSANQQVFVIGTMRYMTVAAIFLNRGVFPEEGAAFFGVAVRAFFISSSRYTC